MANVQQIFRWSLGEMPYAKYLELVKDLNIARYKAYQQVVSLATKELDGCELITLRQVRYPEVEAEVQYIRVYRHIGKNQYVVTVRINELEPWLPSAKIIYADRFSLDEVEAEFQYTTDNKFHLLSTSPVPKELLDRFEHKEEVTLSPFYKDWLPYALY